MLAYAVEQALLGNAGDLKERTSGVKAFGREPDYDVNLDPVVRTTAAEVRKRLIQYYYSPEHARELIIELPVGSYVPAFREPALQPAARSESEVNSQQIEQTLGGPIETEVLVVDTKRTPSRLTAFRWSSIAIALVLAVLVGIGIGRARFPDQPASLSGPSNMARFWEPITATSSRVTYCLGVTTESVDLQHRTFPVQESGSLNVYDVITPARSIVPLVPKNGGFRVLAASATGFAQLREGPFVLIGAFDNPWAMRIRRICRFDSNMTIITFAG